MRGQQCTAAIISRDLIPVPPPPPASPDPHRKVFINDRAFIFKQRRSTVRRSMVGCAGPSKSGTVALQNQKVFCLFVFFSACEWAQMMHLAIGSNLCWKSRPDRTQAQTFCTHFVSVCCEQPDLRVYTRLRRFSTSATYQ